MLTKDTVVLEVGTSKLSAVIGSVNENGVYDIKSIYKKDYAGFMNGEWLEEEKLDDEVFDVLQNAMEKAGLKSIKKIFIGVPSEFSSVVVKEVTTQFEKPKTINNRDLEALFDKGDDFQNKSFSTINRSPIYYKLYDGKRIVNPIGAQTDVLTGMLSYVLCDRSFVNVFERMLNGFGVKQVEFISESLASVVGLFEPEQRDRYVVLLDVGYLTSSVSLARGDGLLHLASFSLGGANIAADISDYLAVPYQKANDIKEGLDLNLVPTLNDFYRVSYRGESYRVAYHDIYELVYDRLDVIASYLKKAIDMCAYDFPQYLPIYLVGGGISYLRGAREYLSKAIDRPIEIIGPKVPNYEKPEYSVLMGLLKVACNANISLWENLKNKIKGFLTK